MKLNSIAPVASSLRFVSLLGGCAVAVTLLGASPAFAGCNSGNVANTLLLSDPACQATATGADSTAVGAGATAAGSGASAYGRSATAGAGGSNDGDTAVGFFSTATGAATEAATALGSF